MSDTEAHPTRQDRGAVVPPDIFDPDVNALRFLAVDAVNLANSGHPGTPLDIAPVITRLFTRHLRHDPADPTWWDRDRFVLSGGHASMVLYGALYLSGYDVTMEDLKSFRQLGARTAGHPERGLLPGVEVTTGPLGQGVANAVGMAIAERMLAAEFNTPEHTVVDHRTYVTCGDGDLMEGISSEASSLAGHLGLGKLTLLYDDNRVSLDGPASLAFSEEVATRYLAYGWHVVRLLEVDDFAEIDRALAEAETETERPTIVIMHTHIGIGTPIHDSNRAHGAPVGPEYAGVARGLLEWPYEPFEIPDAVLDSWRSKVRARAETHEAWKRAWASYQSDEPALAAELERRMRGELPEKADAVQVRFTPGERISTRVAGGQVLNALAEVVPELAGGAADVESSTETHLKGASNIRRGHFEGRNLYFGVREHAMGAITNGIAAHGGIRPYAATFFCFSDYLRPALRLSAIMELPTAWVFTHDSIWLGEDGTTHQPVEHLASLRAMPGVEVIRPADANETALAWQWALRRQAPTALVLSRQALPVLDPDRLDLAGARLVEGDALTIVASGSEVEVAL
jgi:transketolase